MANRGAEQELKRPYSSQQEDASIDRGSPIDVPERNEPAWSETNYDMADMKRLGKKQEFKRNFNFLSTLGFVSVYMATWEFVLVSLSVGLTNGGFGGLFWTWCGTVLCYATIVASLAELASIAFFRIMTVPGYFGFPVRGLKVYRAPTSGGQYHWVSEFAPSSYQKFLSYASGWMSSLGWLASVTGSVFVVTTQVQAMVNVTDSEHAFTNWQYTLIMLAFMVITIFFNTWGAQTLPMLETISLFGHIAGFIITIIPLWVLCSKNSASAVFTEVVNNGGWSNTGTACLVSQVTVMFCNIGSDSIVHISEEVENASLNVPRAMWWSYLGNVFLGTIMLITMLFCIGDLDDAIDSDAPYLILFTNTGSTPVALLLSVVLFILIFAGNINALATVSREIWAFSRDKGFPFAKWISHMNHRWNVPFNSVYLASIIGSIFCLINLGSSFGFNVIVSLSLLALLSTYMISIGCVLRKRLLKEELPPARWSLGRLGLPVNAFAFCYSFFVIIFSCFPSEVPVDLMTTNWAPAVWAGVILIAVVVYVLHGRRKYTPPVIFVEGRKAPGTGLEST